MRIAFCLYGQPRNFSSNWDHFHKNIIDGNDVDVFLHTWYDPNNMSINKMDPGFNGYLLEKSLDISIPEITKPKRFIIEKQKEFNDKLVKTTDENIDECWSYSKGYDRDQFIRDRVKSNYSMWYSINQSILMKELYPQIIILFTRRLFQNFYDLLEH